MKSLRKFFLLSALGLVIFLNFASCMTTFDDDENFGSCPYILSSPRVELGENSDVCKYAGAYFTLYNKSSKEISKCTISFLLYDKDGNNPFIGSNQVTASCSKSVASESEEDFSVSLDKYLSIVPDEAYVMDFIYVRDITYSDGSHWSDPFGMYASSEAFE